MDALKKLQKNKREFILLTLILLVGIFLRTYNLHEWMVFRDDQARDAALVSQVVTGETAWPLQGAFMSFSGDGDHNEENSYHLGPMYYYFQIISAEMFGADADKQAYPDVLFGILTIPLLFVFLRIYFRKNLSLGITGLFALSSYFVQYSRFAWNMNLIPFFVLLLLFSLHAFLVTEKRKSWWRALALGTSLGVGVQLHVILTAIFLPLAFITFFFSLKKGKGVWKEWVLVLLVIGVLNMPQIMSEMTTGFSNTKTLFDSVSKRGSAGTSSLITSIGNDIDCAIESNAYFLSSHGGSSCGYDFLSLEKYQQMYLKNLSGTSRDFLTPLVMLLSIVFSVSGYLLLIWYGKKEKDEKKRYFLYLVAAYCAIAFLVMIPLSKEKFNDFRYFTPTFFVSFVLLGLIGTFLREKFSNAGLIFMGLLFLLLVFTNGNALYEQAVPLLLKDRTCNSHFTTLGELEPVADYMVANAGDQKSIYLRGDGDLHVISSPLWYLLKKQGVDSVEMGRNLEVPQKEVPAYLINCKVGWRDMHPYVAIDNFFVFRIQ